LAEQTRILISGATRRTGPFGVFLAGQLYHKVWLAPTARVDQHGTNQMEVRA
jgi:hypothetical protein